MTEPAATAPESLISKAFGATFLTPSVLSDATKLVLRQEAQTRRIIEEVELRDSSLLRHVTMELDVNSTGWLLVPILRPSRGALVDNLQLEDSDGRSGFTLNRHESQIVSTYMVQAALLKALNRTSPEDLDDEERLIFDRLSRLPAERPSRAKAAIDGMREMSRKFAALDDPQALTKNLRMQVALARDNELLDLLDYFSQCRTIFVPMKAEPPSLKVTFSHETGIELATRRSLNSIIRTALSYAPDELGIEIPLALRTPSYHLRFRAPQGFYFVSNELQKTRYRTQANNRRLPDKWELVRFTAPRMGAGPTTFIEGDRPTSHNYTHIYAGNISMVSDPPRRLFADISVRERPPGQFGSTLMKALIVATSGALLVAYGETVVGSGRAAPALPLLLALPGALGLFKPWDRTKTAPLSSTLVRVLEPVIALCAFAHAATYMLWASANASRTSIAHTSEARWSFAIFASAAALAACCCGFRLVEGLLKFSSALEPKATSQR